MGRGLGQRQASGQGLESYVFLSESLVSPFFH